MMNRVLFSKYFLFAFSLLLCLLVLELGTRVWVEFFASRKHQFRYSLYENFPKTRLRLSPHHYLDYYPTPNYKNRLASHNSLGYRGREFPTTKPEGVFRIVALGGSTTYTTSVNDNAKMFTRQLENELRDRYHYDRVEVINAGVPGFNSWESLINLQFRVLDLDPDLIMIYHGVNDVHTRLVEPGAYRGDNSGRRKQWDPPEVRFWEYSAFGRLVSRATNLTPKHRGVGLFVNADTFLGYGSHSGFWQKDEAIDMLEDHPPVFFERNLTNMTAIAGAHGIQVVLPTFAYSREFDDYTASEVYRHGLREGNGVIRSVARRFDVPLFEFSEVMPQDAKYWSDGRHVNDLGAAEKARLFGAFLHENALIQRPKDATDTSD